MRPVLLRVTENSLIPVFLLCLYDLFLAIINENDDGQGNEDILFELDEEDIDDI